MRIYLADSCKNNLVSVHDGMHQRGLSWRMLLSYYYFKNIKLDEWLASHFKQPYPRIFLDSGAFSAMTQKAKIDLDDYARYITRYRHLIEVYANLDVIKNAEATWQNQQRLEQEYGLAPLPVFHVMEPWSYLERYLDQYSYIALGVAGSRSPVYMSWLVQCFKRAQERGIFYHGFGITTWHVLKAFPWHSVDSSTWGDGYRFGHFKVFSPKTGSFTTVHLGNHNQCYSVASLMRFYGFDPADFAMRTRNAREKICIISALSYLQAEAWLTRRFSEITIPHREEIA